MRRTVVLGCCAALLSSTPFTSFAAPGFPPEEICTFDPAEIPPRRLVDPSRLIRWLIADGQVSDAALDANADGDTLLVEKQLTFTQPDYCAVPGRNCTTADAAAIRRLHDQMDEFVGTQGGAYYRFERLQQPDAVDRAAVPALDAAFEVEGQHFQIGEVLNVPARYVRITCRDEPTLAPPAVADAAPPEPSPPVHWTRDRGGDEGFRLTGSIDDLSRDRTRLTSVQPATFSINSDLSAGRTSYFVNFVAGYDFEFERGELYETSIIPFVLLNRLLQDSGSEIDRLGAGTQVATAMYGGALGYGEIAVTPLYLTDTSLSSRIGTLKGRWSPRLAEDAPLPLGFYQEYDALLAQLELDLLTDVGHIFEAGDNPDLTEDDSFLRAGGRIGLRVRGAAGSALERIELNVSNRYLYNWDGDPENLNLFQVSLSYLFPQLDNYRLSFAYSNGRTDDTLNLVHYWSTQLGVRF